MKKPRQIARELALLGISQLPTQLDRLANRKIDDLLAAAIKTLMTEIKEELENASDELQKGTDRLIASEIRAPDVQTARTMVTEAIGLTQTAINRIGSCLEIPEILQMTNQQDVRNYALEIVTKVFTKRIEIDKKLNQVMVDWKLERLPRIDQDILRIAVVDMLYLGIAQEIAINEAIELAKQYSGEDSHKFLNGVLRRFVDSKK